MSLGRILESSDSITSETLGDRGSEREFRAKRRRTSCSWTVGFEESIERAVRRQRRASRYFSSGNVRKLSSSNREFSSYFGG